jgi:hypothetical protein
MLASISPFGERARGQRWGVTVTAYVAGSTVSGTAVGALLGAAGSGLARVAGVAHREPVALAALTVVAIAGLLLDAGVAGLHVPGPARQVDETWLGRYRGWVYGAGFGLQLGAAFTTIVAGAITYVAFASAFLSPSPVAGAVIGFAFGLTRALPLVAAARVTTPDELRVTMRRVDAALPRARAVATSAQVVAALVALIAALALAGA